MTETTETPAAPDGPQQRPPLPRTLVIASAAIVGQIGFSVVNALQMLLMGGSLRSEILRENRTAKKPRVLCSVHNVKDCLDVAKAARSEQIATTIGTAVISIALVVLLLRIRRGVRVGRTIYVGVTILGQIVAFAGTPLSLLYFASSWPIALRIMIVLAGASSLVALFAVFQRPSNQYFDAVSPRPVMPAGRGGLFRPRTAAPPKSQQPSGPRSSAASRGEARVAKSKSRNDAESIARGAELARTRAKAAKSRRPTS